MLVAENVTHIYTSGGRPLPVLQDIDLHIESGELVAVVGPSGSGKTTLLGLLAGLDLASEGTISVLGRNLRTLSEDARARLRAEMVGFVFQSFHLLPTLTARENVQVPMELYGEQLATSAEARAAELLEQVGLADRQHHYPAQLSGGEQQRVAIARALANRPKLLFADEPTGNLDRANGDHVLDLLLEAHRDAGTTLVLVTHDPTVAGRADRVLHLDDGRLVRDVRS